MTGRQDFDFTCKFKFFGVVSCALGKVTGKINCSGLLDKTKVTKKVDVLNGIAWDQQNNKLYLTGKLWPQIYEVQIVKL